MEKPNKRKKNTLKKMPVQPKREVIIKAVAPIGKLHDKSKLLLVVLDGFKINNLLSKDLLKREGTLAFEIDGQTLSIGWKASKTILENQASFQNRLLYFGDPKGALEFRTDVIETDKEEFDARFKTGDKVLTFVGSVASFMPSYGPMISAGAAVLRSFVKFLRTHVDDDVELSFQGSLGDFGVKDTSGGILPIKTGAYCIIRRKRDTEKSEIELPFTLLTFKPLNPAVTEKKKKYLRHAAILLESIDFSKLNRNKIKDRILKFESGIGSGKNEKKFNIDIKAWNNPALIDDILGIRNQLLYEGPWIGGVPFSFNSIALKQKDIKAIDDLIAKTGSFVATIRERELTERGEAVAIINEEKALISNVTTATQSFASMAAEFVKGKVSIGSASGLIHEAGCIENLISYKLDENLFPIVKNIENKWESFKISLNPMEGGEITLKLRIRQYLVEKKPPKPSLVKIVK